MLLERERRGGVGERCCFGGEGGGVEEDEEEGEGELKRDA